MRGSPYGKQLPEGPINELMTIIENTSPEDWQKRTQAFVSLVSLIPASIDEYGAYETWFNSPTTLRHLAWPLSELLRDARSSVVKRTCEACAELFEKCQSDARYLLKDLMQTVLTVHGQTVAVIRAAVEDMIVNALSITPCKMAMPLWLDRLKSDKSRTVREACALYLGVGLSEWGATPGYLSLQIWDQVGTALVKALRDPAPAVRKNSKKGLEIVFQQQPGLFDKLLDNSSLVRDARVKKLLQRIHAGEVVGDDISVASSRVGSVASRSYYRGGGGGGSVAGSRSNNNMSSPSYLKGTGVSRARGIPMTIGVTTPNPPPPKPRATTRRGNGLGPPGRVQGPFSGAMRTPQKERLSAYSGLNGSPTNASVEASYPDPSVDLHPASTSFDTADTADSELPVIASADALREYAKSRGSKRSSMLQERFARSMSSNTTTETSKIPDTLGKLDTKALESNDEPPLDLEDILDMKPADAASKGAPELLASRSDLSNSVPEHIRIAQEVLEAHKKHVDQVMETLKVEMDALKEFEVILLDGAPQRPTEDEVLEYFESVGLCVEQRAKAGSILQKKMDKISQGGS